MKWFCSLYAQLAILFQQKCGHRVSHFSELSLPGEHQHISLIEYEHIDVGLSATKLARRVITLRTADFRKSFATLREFSMPLALPGFTRAVIEAARKGNVAATKLDRWPFETELGHEFEKYQPICPNGRLLLGQCRNQQVVDGTYCQTKSGTPADFGEDEHSVSSLLDRLGIPRVECESPHPGTGSNYRIIIGNGELLAVLGMNDSPEIVPDPAGAMDETIIEQALSIYHELDTALLAVDLRINDPSSPLSPPLSGVIGFDAAPRLDGILPDGSPVMSAAADLLIAWLFPGDSPSNVPVIAITGTNGKTTVTRMVESILRAAGFNTGFVCTDGVFINRKLVYEKDQSQVYGHLKVLTSPIPDAAVLECHHAGLASTGFAFDRCDTALCTNVSEEHFGKLGVASVEDMALLKRSLIERARETAILNADDRHCLAMLPFVSARRTCLVSVQLDEGELAGLLEGIPCCCFLEDREGVDWIVITEGATRHDIMPVAEIPATFDGLARFNVANAMQSIAACHFTGIAPDSIRKAMSTFGMSPENTPWRLNFYEGLPFRVLVDFAHSPDAVARIAEFTDAIEGVGKRFITFSSPVSRNDQHAINIARAAANHFDHYVVKIYGALEERDKGKILEPEQLSELLKSALLDCGVPERCISVVEDELDAVERCLDMAAPGDLVVLLLGYKGMRAIAGIMQEYIERYGQGNQG